MPFVEPTRGTIVGGRYRVVDRLGAGTAGPVFRADPLSGGGPVALRLLRASTGDHAMLRRLFEHARAAARVDDAAAATLLDTGVGSVGPYLVLELLRGESVAAARARGALFTPPAVVAIGLAALSALGAAHRAGVLHGDLRPSSLFLHRQHGRTTPKLLDLGLARMLGPRRVEADGPSDAAAYLSPEQVLAGGTIDGRSDLFSLAVVLFELCTGAHPFAGDSPRDTAYGIARAAAPTLASRGVVGEDALERALARALAKAPADRYTTAAEMARALEAAAPDAARRAEALDALRDPDAAHSTTPPPVRVAPSRSPSSLGLLPESARRVVPGSGSSTSLPPASGPDRRPSSQGAPVTRESASRVARAPASRAHVRGNVLRAVDAAAVVLHGEAARERALERLDPPLAEGFRARAHTALVLYEVELLVAYVHALDATVPGGARERELGRVAATGELSALVRTIVRDADLGMLLRRAADVFGHLASVGGWRVTRGTSGGAYLVEVRDCEAAPRALREFWVGLLEGTLDASRQAAPGVEVVRGSEPGADTLLLAIAATNPG